MTSIRSQIFCFFYRAFDHYYTGSKSNILKRISVRNPILARERCLSHNRTRKTVKESNDVYNTSKWHRTGKKIFQRTKKRQNLVDNNMTRAGKSFEFLLV